MAGCGKKIEVWVARGYHGKEITVECGNTSEYGTPYLCEECEKIHKDVDWKAEAEAAGERWEPLD